MVILTGGAGFIGSCFLGKLNSQGITDIIVVDDLNSPDKKKNLENKKFKDYIDKDEFIKKIKENKIPSVERVVHMGACSSTIFSNRRYYIENNYEYSQALAEWSVGKKAKFLYASSAATYGAGEFGYDDSDETTFKLKPLNFYGESKQLFDLWVLKKGYGDKFTGLKFFNVFGPNEYHKGEMRSVICKKFQEVKDEEVIRLFKSYLNEYKDGEQRRDFIYIKDALEVMYFFFVNPDKAGIFNLGTGMSRTWNDIAKAMFSAVGKELKIEYIDMPEYLKDKYQYFTEAKMDKLRDAGYNMQFRELEDSVKDYTGYLEEGKRM